MALLLSHGYLTFPPILQPTDRDATGPRSRPPRRRTERAMAGQRQNKAPTVFIRTLARNVATGTCAPGHKPNPDDPNCRYEGKRHGREKKCRFPLIPSRPKSLLNPGFGDVERGFAGVFTPHLPCFGPGTALGGVPGATVAAKSLFTPLRYGRDAKLSVFSSYRRPQLPRKF